MCTFLVMAVATSDQQHPAEGAPERPEAVATREDELRWRSVFDHSMDAVLLTDPVGTIFAANITACRMLGRTEEEICTVGRGGIVVMNSAALRFIAERERTGHARGVVQLRRKDGSTFLAEVSSAIFSTANGQRRTSMSFHDVTERERARQALEILADAGRVLSNSLDIQQTLDNLTHLVVPQLADVCTVDLLEHGQVRRVAASHRDPSRVGMFVGIRHPVPLEDSPGGVDRVLRTGEPSAVYEVTDDWLRSVTRDEEHFQAARRLSIRSLITTPLVARGRIIGALSLISDGGVPAFTEADLPLVGALAERAALAIDNAREHQDAVEARRLRDEVLGVVSHDLRNPLNTTVLSAATAARRAPNPQLDTIKRAAQRADRLIQDLLTAAQADSGGLALELEVESVASVLEEVAQLHRPIAEAQQLTLTVAAGADAGEAKLDRHRVVQLLSNLIGNALKFTPAGGRIALRAAGDERAVRFSVADTGPGISREDLPHVFDRFWQGAHAREAGAGLGLSIARSIAEAHGGSIAVESHLGEGTVFTVTLPRG